MMIFLMLFALVTGSVPAVALLLSGAPLWSAFLVYSAAGSAGCLLAAGLLLWRHRDSPADDAEISLA